MKRTCWRECNFGAKWGDLIGDEAISHPAKFNRGPLEKFIDYGFTCQMWKTGDLIADPMAGVGMGGVACVGSGLRWWGMEIDSEYVKAGVDTFDRLRDRAFFYCLSVPKITAGDSRIDFALGVGEHPQAIITSPPYCQSLHAPGGCRLKIKTGRSHFHNPDDAYGQSNGQIGRMKGDDYWKAMKLVYEECAKSKTRYLCLFLRDYVRKWKRVPFVQMTRQCVELSGFRCIREIRMMMGSHASFFRRLNIAKGLPISQYEKILIFRRR